MARFTDPDKWKDAWFRKLKPAEKLVWLYIVDTCDNAGFFEYDPEMISFFTGMELERVEGAYKGLIRGLVGPKGDGEYHVKNFLKHQRNLPLNDSNNAHRQIIRILEEKRGLFSSLVSSYLGANKALTRGPVKVKVEYSKDFEEWWSEYGKGSKKNASDAWKKQNISSDDLPSIIKATGVYKEFCKSTDRPLKDGQGFLNGRFWENEWTVEKQGAPKNQNSGRQFNSGNY